MTFDQKMRRGDKTPEDLNRPDGNGLEANYEKHDVGHAALVERLNDDGYIVEDWGIDMRGDDGEDGIIYDDKMDFKVYQEDSGDLVGLVDVKTKSSPSYMGRFNERHYLEYYEHAVEHDVPVFVVMFQVDYKTNTVQDEFVFEISDETDLGEQVKLSSQDDAVEAFPDGNHACLVPHEERRSWGWLTSGLNLTWMAKLSERDELDDYIDPTPLAEIEPPSTEEATEEDD